MPDRRRMPWRRPVRSINVGYLPTHAQPDNPMDYLEDEPGGDNVELGVDSPRQQL